MMFRAFTLIEMVVVLAIISVLVLVVITSQSSFNRSLILSNTAYDIALSLRSAQSYGVGSRSLVGVARTGYGVSFRAATPTRYAFFADSHPGPSTSDTRCHPALDRFAPDAKAGDCVYRAADTKLTDYQLREGITIANICALSAGAWQCQAAAGAAATGLTQLDVVFVRPGTEAYLSKNGAYSAAAPVSQACIELTSPAGGTRIITVRRSGEINVGNGRCP